MKSILVFLSHINNPLVVHIVLLTFIGGGCCLKLDGGGCDILAAGSCLTEASCRVCTAAAAVARFSVIDCSEASWSQSGLRGS